MHFRSFSVVNDRDNENSSLLAKEIDANNENNITN